MDITDYMNMIMKVANTKSRHTGIEFDELRGRGIVLFYEAQAEWDETKAAFSTFFWMRLNQQIVPYKAGNGNVQDHIVDTEACEMAVSDFAPPHVIAEFRDTLKNLSVDAREIVSIILGRPEEIVDGAIGRSKLMAGNVRRILKEQGWGPSRMATSFREIRSALN